MTAPAIDVPLTPAQELYRAEKARRADRLSPAMAEAAAELERMEAQRREDRKGGRPKSTGVLVGKARTTRDRFEPDPDAPGRPEWLTPPTPVREDTHHSPPRPTMPRGTPSNGFAPKACAFCGNEFIPKGSRQIFCGDECKQLGKDAAPAPKKAKKAKTAKPEKPAKKKKRVATGFRAESPPTRSTPTARSSDHMDGVIAGLEAELDAIDAHREEVFALLESARKLAA